MLSRKQDREDKHQTSIIQENVKEPFSFFLKSPLNIGILGAHYFSSGDFQTKNYAPFADDVLALNKEILGMSILGLDGKILRVYPTKSNPHTGGKISQNTPYIKKSLAKNERYRPSPPFMLYQGCQGFAFYVPILRACKAKG